MNRRTLCNYLLFAGLAILFTSLFFPGMMSSDSERIYNEVLNHSYSDHHPPMMAYFWHYLNYIYQGPLMMYLFNMLLLWGGIYILVFKIFHDSPYLKYYCILIPFIPHILVSAGWIWKDIIFAFGYGLLSMYLAWKLLANKKLEWPSLMIFIVTLIYFTSVKYQAQFICPIIIFWLFYVQNLGKVKAKIFWGTTVASIAIIISVNHINHYLVSERGTGSSHSWQYVKIFDLAGMSVKSDTVFIPRALLTRSKVTAADIKPTFTLAWETLIFSPNSVIMIPHNDQERHLLLLTWQNAVLRHPLSYLQHRYSIWEEGLLLSSPGKLYLQEKLINYPMLAKYLVPLASLSAFVYLIPFMLASVYIAIRSLKYNFVRKHAIIILFLMAMSIELVAILFFKSLASVPRYVYFSVYLFMLSTPFSIYCLRHRP